MLLAFPSRDRVKLLELAYEAGLGRKGRPKRSGEEVRDRSKARPLVLPTGSLGRGGSLGEPFGLRLIPNLG